MPSTMKVKTGMLHGSVQPTYCNVIPECVAMVEDHPEKRGECHLYLTWGQPIHVIEPRETVADRLEQTLLRNIEPDPEPEPEPDSGSDSDSGTIRQLVEANDCLTEKVEQLVKLVNDQAAELEELQANEPEADSSN